MLKRLFTMNTFNLYVRFYTYHFCFYYPVQENAENNFSKVMIPFNLNSDFFMINLWQQNLNFKLLNTKADFTIHVANVL